MRDGSLLGGTQNSQWILIDSNDEIEEIHDGDVSNLGQTPTQSGDDGLSSPSADNSGSRGDSCGDVK